MKTRIIFLNLIMAVLTILLFQTACNKQPETIGLDVLDESKLGVYDTTFTISGYSTYDDSVRTDELSITSLGSIQTEGFGLTNTSFYSQLRLSQTSPDFGEEPQPDSAVLILVYSGYYGYLSTPQTVKVYELIEDIYKDSVYYSTSQFNIEPLPEFANYTFIPNPTDSILGEDSTYSSGELRIPLSEEFINKVMFPEDDSVLNSSDNFIEYFNGIYVVTDSVSGQAEGSILYFSLINPRSNVTIYYNDSLTYEYVINSNCATVGNYRHNYTKSQNQNFISQVVNGDTTNGSEYLYLQGLSGIKTKISFPALESWVETGKYAINEARLIIPAIEVIEELKPPVKLILLEYDENGDLTFIDDQQEGENYFGGSYNESANVYEFRISLYIQSILNGTPDYGVALYPTGKSVNANQVTLFGTDPSNEMFPSMRLRIIYTLLE